MTLKVLAAIGSAAILSASAQWPTASLEYGYSDNGLPVFSLDIPASQWAKLVGDEPLDTLHPIASSRIVARLDYYVARSLRVAHWCPGGWDLAEYSFDGRVYHFKGACRRPLRV